MFSCLENDKFNYCEEHLGVFGIHLLFFTQFHKLVLLELLAHHFLDDLGQHHSKFYSADFVEENHFGEDPLGAVHVTTKLKSHLSLIIIVLKYTKL